MHLLAVGHTDAVVVLCEHTHLLAEKAIQYVDDADGWITNLSMRIGDLHIQA